MESKLLEIRDAGTFIPVLAVSIAREDGYLARRAGFGSRCIYLVHLEGHHCAYNPYDWTNRTMCQAHQYIERNWDVLESGDVIDVEFILGETTTRKESEEVTTTGS
jgi:selenophosphate synthetase-related protein